MLPNPPHRQATMRGRRCQPKDWTLYEREPIKLSSHAMMLIHLFTRTDRLEDICWLDGDLTNGVPGRPYRKAARQMMNQLEGQHCIAFLLALRDEINHEVAEWKSAQKHRPRRGKK